MNWSSHPASFRLSLRLCLWGGGAQEVAGHVFDSREVGRRIFSFRSTTRRRGRPSPWPSAVRFRSPHVAVWPWRWRLRRGRATRCRSGFAFVFHRLPRAWTEPCRCRSIRPMDGARAAIGYRRKRYIPEPPGGHGPFPSCCGDGPWHLRNPALPSSLKKSSTSSRGVPWLPLQGGT